MVFEQAGWVGRDAILMTGINGIVYVASTIPPWYLMDKWGRRPILLSGAIIMSVALAAISYFIYIDVYYTPRMVVIFVIIYNAFFGYSWGPVPWYVLHSPCVSSLILMVYQAVPPGDHASEYQSQGSFTFNCNQLGVQLASWGDDPHTTRLDQMAPLSRARFLLRRQFCTWYVHSKYRVLSGNHMLILSPVYFVYPETKGVQLEDMDAIFGDQTVVATPATASQSLLHPSRAGSPVPSLDIGRADAKRSGLESDSGRRRGFAGWFTGIFGKSESEAGGNYRRLDEDDV